MTTFDINKILKLGRNDKCWCGSDLKFKRCHLDREKQKPISKGESITSYNNLMKREKCYVPQEIQSECSKIINSHTVSKSSGLADIADNTNHVLGLKQNFATFSRNKGKLKFEKIGINKASTFKGFCAKHDKTLFSSFEDHPFIGTEEQCFGLTYRALAREIYAKEAALSHVDFMKQGDKGKTLFYQIDIQENIKCYEMGTKKAIKELSELKNNLDNIMLKRSYRPLTYLVIESSKPIPIVVSSIVYPMYDFEGYLIQDLFNLEITPEHLIFNAFCSNGKGFVLFSWLQDNKIIEGFINSLIKLNSERIFSALVRFFFSSAENSFISPEWWHNLSTDQKTKIEELIMFDVGAFSPMTDNILADNRIEFSGWNAEKIYKF